MTKVYAKKRFGQNFISDPNLIQKIVSLLGDNPNILVIEIGPGIGALTTQLVRKFKQIIAIEIDQDLVNHLQQNFQVPNLEILSADILKIDFEELIKKYQKPNQKVYLISNLPYYITGEILFKTLNSSSLFTKAVFMMQKEVAQRICAHKNENNYNNLSIAAEFYAERKYEFTVSKNKFNPIPKVDSAIVSLTFRNDYQNQIKNDQEFIQFVRVLFNNRRKTILNNLTNLTKEKSIAQELLNSVKINSQLRPENIDLVEFINLFNAFTNKIK